MPTSHPRYTVTDTGDLRRLLDEAHERWPEITDRKQLLLRLAVEGGKALEFSDAQITAGERRTRAQAALARIPSLVDEELLLSDRAWD